jgi:outer membrane lipoprotein-sorting protein
MKRVTIPATTLIMLLAWLTLTPYSYASKADDHAAATRIIQQVQDLLRANNSYARYHMQIVTADWQRDIRFDSWDDRLQRRFFVRILEPRKDHDTTWLKNGKNLWMFIPRLERDIRIPPSMMLSSWMGSDFTNDDLVKMESVVEDYEHHIIARDDTTVTIESIPHPNAPVVWGKLIHVINNEHLPLSVAYYDEHNSLVRTMHYSEVKTMDGRRLPTRWVMQSASENSKQTILTMEQVDFDLQLNDAMFSRKRLRQHH